MALMSGLPDSGRRVWVGPPLFATTPSIGFFEVPVASVAALKRHETAALASSEKLKPFDVVLVTTQFVPPPAGWATTDPKLVKATAACILEATVALLFTTVAYTSVTFPLASTPPPSLAAPVALLSLMVELVSDTFPFASTPP